MPAATRSAWVQSERVCPRSQRSGAPWQLAHETPSSGPAPVPRRDGLTPARGAWQTTQRGLDEGSGIASASAILAARAVVRVAKEREWASSWDQTANWSLRSPAPPWQPLVEHVPAPSVAASARSTAPPAARPTAQNRPRLIAGRIFIRIGGRTAPFKPFSYE